MLGYDTMHILAPIDGLIAFDAEKFIQNAKFEPDGSENAPRTFTLKKGAEKPLGVASVAILAGGVDLTFSAKVLGRRYIEGLNWETFDQIAPALRSLVELEPLAIEQAQVFRVDATANIRPKNKERTALSFGAFASLNDKYQYRPHKGGFELSYRADARNERFIGYDKEREMYRHKQEAYALGVENFGNVFRIESNLRQFKAMHHYLGLDAGKIILADVFNSKKNANLLLFDSIIAGIHPDVLTRQNSFQAIDGITIDGTGTMCMKNIAIDAIIEHYDGNWDAVKACLLLIYAGMSKPWRELKRAKERVALYHARKSQAVNLLASVVEVRELLSKVA